MCGAGWLMTMPMAPSDGVRAHVDHGAGETLVADRRHRHQNAAVEITAVPVVVAIWEPDTHQRILS